MATVWSDKDPGETVFVSFDWTDEIGSETVASTQDCTIAVVGGFDAGYASVLSGAAMTAALITSQKVVGGLHGVDYKIIAQITTSSGRILMLPGILRVRNA